MTIRLQTPLPGHYSDLAEVARVFFPDARVCLSEGPGEALSHTHAEGEDWACDAFAFRGKAFRWTVAVAGDRWEQKRRRKRGMKQALYYLLKEITGVSPPWGSLTGIRPTRLLYERLARGESLREGREALTRLFDLREGRAQLLEDTVAGQRGLIEAQENAVDIYAGIPYCTTRCAYCSFFTEALGKGRQVPAYLEALLRELSGAAEVAERAGLVPRALYVGGGTPTALTAEQLRAVLIRLGEHFPGAAEWTVEAGRPDTIDGEKLRVMREAGVTRISVNPQTMHDETLRAIGRGHTAEDTRRAFHLAREAGFDNINMDIIAGLPGETPAVFAGTLEEIGALSPDSLTVHTLARKHGSRLNELGFDPAPAAAAEEMVEMGARFAREAGMGPYYLYRQKYAAGNLENVAYAAKGKECLYNIDMMEETVSILAVGAGAISKRIYHGEARIERAPNVGDVGHYLSRAEEMMDRKRKLWEV